MKNKYLTKYFCISMISAAALTAPVSVLGAETAAESSKQSGGTAEIASGLTSAAVSSDSEVMNGTEAAAAETAAASTDESAEPTAAPTSAPAVSEGADSAASDESSAESAEVTVTPTTAPTDSTVAPTTAPEEPAVTPTEAPAEPAVTPAETPADSTVTPTEAPADPAVTPTAEPTVTPSVTPAASPEPIEIPAKVQKIIDRIDALSLTEISISSEKEIKSIRKAYDALSDDNKELVSNYTIFVNMEAELAEITQDEIFSSGEDITGFSDGTDEVSAVEGTPVYVTSMVSNLHAGKDFYLNSLTDLYRLTFSDDFAAVMEEIEKEYKAANNLTDASDGCGGTSSADTYLVRNWQDILAVYVYRRSLAGEESFTLDASCKEELAEIFAELNPLVSDETDPNKLVYANYHINYYIKEHKIAKEDREILKKYTETDCSLLCAVVTGARGFVRQSVGDDVSEERVNVITAAYSLIGKVGYFWGGKSTVLGDDPSWGSVMQVTASGSKSTGKLRAYGLDCSGFVTWAVINGYQDTGVQSAIGDGTTNQWLLAEVVSEADAQPGDLVFEAGPEAGEDNHVGIICGKTDSGDWIVVHCSSSQNGVTVGEAYSAGFRYIRRPTVYNTVSGESGAEKEDTVDPAFLDGMTVENSLAGLQESARTDGAGDTNETAGTNEAVETGDSGGTGTAEVAGPVFVNTDDGTSAGETDENAGQAEQSSEDDSVKQELDGISVDNALAALNMDRSQVSAAESVVPDMVTENALQSLLGGRQSRAVSAGTVQELSAVQTSAYTAAVGSGGTPVDGVKTVNALCSILR